MVVPSTEKAKRDFADRLKRVFVEVGGFGPERGLTQRVAKHFRKAFTYQAVQKWLNGSSLPETVHLVLICTDLKVSIDWLFTGEGQMLIADRERGHWPFKFEQKRFDDLTRGQKVAIEGVLLGLIIDYENSRPIRTVAAGR